MTINETCVAALNSVLDNGAVGTEQTSWLGILECQMVAIRDGDSFFWKEPAMEGVAS